MGTPSARLAAGLVLPGLLLSACGPLPPQYGPLYRWGIYEDVVYDMYLAPSAAGPTEQIQALTDDITETETQGMRVPPGVHAHLGYMHYLAGNHEAARDEFTLERELFPESATFVDKIMAQMDQQ